MAKRFAILILTLVFTLSAYTEVRAAQATDYNTVGKNYNVKVYLDAKDNPLAFPAGTGKPFIACGRTFIPCRILAEKLGAKVGWDQTTKSVTAQNAQNTVIMTIDKKCYTVNGKTRAMDVEPFILASESRTYIPARFLIEGLGYKIDSVQDGNTMCITLNTKGQMAAVEQVQAKDVSGSTASSSSNSTGSNSSSAPSSSSISSGSTSSTSSTSSPQTVSSDTSPSDETDIPIADAGSYKIEGTHYTISGGFAGVIETEKYIIEKQSEYIGSDADVITIYPQGIDQIQFTCTNHPELNASVGPANEITGQYSIKGTGYAIPITQGMIIEIKSADGDTFTITL